MGARRHTLCALGVAIAMACTARAAPARGAEPESTPAWRRALPSWLDLRAAYRVETTHLDPLDLTPEELGAATWTEQRLRFELALRAGTWGAIHVQADLLDGVLFGDNGTFGKEPAPTTGVTLTSYRPNRAGLGVGLRPGRDPLDPDSYALVLEPVDPIDLNQVYADVYLPFGLLRVGRQPFAYGDNIAGHEGTRLNDWGVSRYSHVADRILLATKLDEAIAVLTDPHHEVDPSQDRGVFLYAGYDWHSQGDPLTTADDLHGVIGGLMWKVDRSGRWHDVLVTTGFLHRRERRFATRVWGLPARVHAGYGPWTLDAQVSGIVGATEEIAAGFALLSSEPVRRQRIRALGAHLRIDREIGPFVFTLQADYASGDDDPRASSDLTVFSFDRDFNVGLLLFEHVLAFASARSAAVGIENLAQLDAPSFPLTEVATDGRFTNAVALFPQVTAHVVRNARHRVHVRAGVLMAWPAAPGGAVDPVRTILAYDGARIDDDRVNYFGGNPGSYYGTEFDLQARWTYAGFFEWTVEGAALLPGSSLRDANGDAVPAFLVDNRFVFLF